MIGQTSLFEEPAEEKDAEYLAFTDKFKPKLTTDDCYTPAPIYAALESWARKEYDISEDAAILRPFRPGGDYQREAYPSGCIVLDNPPFSILTDICRWYDARGIRYFLFAPTLTLFSGETAAAKLPVGVSITYANGARVNTSFVTNLEPPDILVRTVPELFAVLRDAEAINQAELHSSRPSYDYPPAVMSAPMLSTLAKHGAALTIRKDEAHFIRALDDQRSHRKQIYGAGYLLSTEVTKRKVAATEAAERSPIYTPYTAAPPAVWKLSERERDIIAMLDGPAARLPLDKLA